MIRLIATFIIIDDCNKMEENVVGHLGRNSPKRLLLVMSQHQKEYIPTMNRSYAKMNQRYTSPTYSFSTHVRRTDKMRVPLQPVNKLGSTHLLTKNCNKIE